MVIYALLITITFYIVYIPIAGYYYSQLHYLFKANHGRVTSNYKTYLPKHLFPSMLLVNVGAIMYIVIFKGLKESMHVKYAGNNIYKNIILMNKYSKKLIRFNVIAVLLVTITFALVYLLTTEDVTMDTFYAQDGENISYRFLGFYSTMFTIMMCIYMRMFGAAIKRWLRYLLVGFTVSLILAGLSIIGYYSWFKILSDYF